MDIHVCDLSMYLLFLFYKIPFMFPIMGKIILMFQIQIINILLFLVVFSVFEYIVININVKISSSLHCECFRSVKCIGCNVFCFLYHAT